MGGCGFESMSLFFGGGWIFFNFVLFGWWWWFYFDFLGDDFLGGIFFWCFVLEVYLYLRGKFI